MKISSQRQKDQFYINWWLTDHCNWDCSYCHDALKKGSLPFPSLLDCKDFLLQVDNYCKSRKLRVNLDITGGEVTVWPHLIEMLEFARQLGHRIKIRTNASQSLDDFSKTLACLDSLQIDFHPEFSQTSHFLLCLNQVSKRQDLSVNIVLNALPERWKEIEKIESHIREKWPRFHVSLRMLFEDPIRNTIPMFYKDLQLEKIKRTNGDISIEHDGGSVEYTDYQNMVLDGKNNLKGSQCFIGVEQIIVDAWGAVRKGHCRQGGSIGNIGSEIRLDGLPVLCRKDLCANSFDILATKIKSS